MKCALVTMMPIAIKIPAEWYGIEELLCVDVCTLHGMTMTEGQLPLQTRSELTSAAAALSTGSLTIVRLTMLCYL